MRIGFYIENRNLTSVDFTRVEAGNPGVGGSEYMAALVATLLSKRDNGIDVVLYVQANGRFDSHVRCEVIDDLGDCIAHCDTGNVDYLFFKHDASFIQSGILDGNHKTGLVPWCHNFAPYWALDYYAANENISRVLCVGREQQDLYRDLRAFNKSDYIYNCISESEVESIDVTAYPFEKRKNIVTYIGAIGYQKGFHWLAEAWPQILREVPDAELYVIGSGALYSRDFELGKWGIAEKSYEDMFMPYLTEGDIILPSVHFMGIMGKEKNDILLRTKVGVPNPSGFSETFGISAVEMQTMGCKVATIKCAGYLDTVRNGRLYDRKSELARTVIDLLMTDSNDNKGAMKHIMSNFSQRAVTEEWERFVLEALPDGKPLHALSVVNMDFEHKRAKEIMRKIKHSMPFLYGVLPSVELVSRIIEKLSGRRKCHPHRNIGG